MEQQWDDITMREQSTHLEEKFRMDCISIIRIQNTAEYGIMRSLDRRRE